MRYLLALPLAAATFWGFAPAQAETYPPEAVQNFMSDCTQKFAAEAPAGFKDRGQAYCTCMIDSIQAKMSFDDYQKLGDNPNDSTLKPIEQSCMVRLF